MNEFVFYFINKNFKYFLNNFWTAHCSARDSFSSISVILSFSIFLTQLENFISSGQSCEGLQALREITSSFLIILYNALIHFEGMLQILKLTLLLPLCHFFIFFFLLQPQYSIWSAFSFFSGHELFPCNLVFYCILGKHNHQLEGNLPFRTCRK